MGFIAEPQAVVSDQGVEANLGMAEQEARELDFLTMMEFSAIFS